MRREERERGVSVTVRSEERDRWLRLTLSRREREIAAFNAEQ